MSPTRVESGAATAGHEVGIQRGTSVEVGNPQQAVVELTPAEVEQSLLYRVEPQYPEEAPQQHIQGSVVLEIHIRPDGRVEAVHLVSGPAPLVQAATDAVKQWCFKPRSDATPMRAIVKLDFNLPK